MLVSYSLLCGDLSGALALTLVQVCEVRSAEATSGLLSCLGFCRRIFEHIGIRLDANGGRWWTEGLAVDLCEQCLFQSIIS